MIRNNSDDREFFCIEFTQTTTESLHFKAYLSPSVFNATLKFGIISEGTYLLIWLFHFFQVNNDAHNNPEDQT